MVSASRFACGTRESGGGGAMPIQAPQWTEYLSCPVCANGFELNVRLPISLGCGHTICKTCLANLQRHQCPFDQVKHHPLNIAYRSVLSK